MFPEVFEFLNGLKNVIEGEVGSLFLEAGKIVERGTHEGLLDLGGRYAELYSLQVGPADTVESTLAQVLPG